MSKATVSFIFILATAFVLVSASGDQNPQEENNVVAQNSGNNQEAIQNLQKDFKEIANQAREALKQVTEGVQQSQIGQSVRSSLEGIIKRTEERAKKLTESGIGKSVSQQAQELSNSQLVKAMMEDFSTINNEVKTLTNQLVSNSQLKQQIGQNLEKINKSTRDGVERLTNSNLAKTVQQGYEQFTKQAQAVLQRVASGPIGHAFQRNLNDLSSQAQKGAGQMSNQLQDGQLAKNVEGQLNDATSKAQNAAQNAAQRVGNLKTVQVAQQGFGGLVDGIQSMASAPGRAFSDLASKIRQPQ